MFMRPPKPRLTTRDKLILALLAFALFALPMLARAGPFADVFSDAERPRIESARVTSMPPLSIDFGSAPVASSSQSQPYAVTIHATTNCAPCVRMKATLKADARLAVTESLNVIPQGIPAVAFPFISFRDDAGTLRYNLTARTADQVVGVIERTLGVTQSAELRRLTPAELRAFAATYKGPEVGISGMTPLWHLTHQPHGYTTSQLAGLTDAELRTIHSADHNSHCSPHGDTPVAAKPQSAKRGRVTEDTRAAAVGGTIYGRERIAAALEFIRSRVGDGVPIRFEWDRTGAQVLPMLRGSAWTPLAIYGRSGEFRLSATGAIRLPVADLSLGYRFTSEGKLRLRGETEIDPSVLDFTRGDAPTAVGSKAVGIDPGTILTVFSVLNGIWQALHPTADLTLGGNISCEAVLRGDVLSVKFSQAPSIRVTAWIQFTLGVERVEVSGERVRVIFSGSRWVKERTFEVK